MINITNLIYLYFYNPLQVINFNSINIKYATPSHVISFFSLEKYFYVPLCHIIFLHWKIVYSYISMYHYKSLILILSTCKYVILSMSCQLFPLKNISKNSRTMPHHLSPLKNNSKNYLMPHHISPLKNNSENSYISITHYMSLISILSTYKDVISSYVMSSFFTKKYF
jgi:hypothetical protein